MKIYVSSLFRVFLEMKCHNRTGTQLDVTGPNDYSVTKFVLKYGDSHSQMQSVEDWDLSYLTFCQKHVKEKKLLYMYFKVFKLHLIVK